ncbi:unnamed protein product [Gordionus sp. m RMFG-2023]
MLPKYLILLFCGGFYINVQSIGYSILNVCTIDRQPPTQCERYSEYTNFWQRWLVDNKYSRYFSNVMACNKYVDSNLHVDLNNFKCFMHPSLGLLYVVHIPKVLEQNLQWTMCHNQEIGIECYNFVDRKYGAVQRDFCDNENVLVFKPPHSFYKIPLHISDCICRTR